MDDPIKTTKHFNVVSADMPQLVECMICGRNTRTDWITKPGYRKKLLHSLWACSYHTDNQVLKKMLGKKK